MPQFVRHLGRSIKKTLTKHPTPEDASSVLKSAFVATIATGTNALIFVATATPSGVSLFLLIWLFATLSLSAKLMSRSSKAAKRTVSRVSKRGARTLILTSVALAIPWAVLPIYVLGLHGDGEPMVLALVSAGMMAGGTIILYRASVAAICYIAVLFFSFVFAFHLGGWPHAWPVTAYAFFYCSFLAYFANRVGDIARDKDNSVSALSDAIDKLRKAHDENYLLANIDDTTGLLNRKAFYAELEKAIDSAKHDDARLTLMMIDLDRFKNVNDLFGHGVGDELLAEVAGRLRDLVRGDDLIGRLGGDEFAILLKDIEDSGYIKSLSGDLLKVLNKPAHLSGRLVHPGASIGVALCPRDTSDATELLVLSDLALSKAKEQGRGQCVVYNDQIRNKVVESNSVESELRAALSRNRVVVEYQPKYNLEDGQLAGAEALVRIKRADGSKLPPDAFLPIAAERGLLPSLSRRIAETVAADIRVWKGKGLFQVKIALNIHPYDIKFPEHLMALIDMFETRGVTSDELILEITEGCFVGRGSDQATFVLDSLSDRGYELSLDDFGTGHASLSHLKAIPVSEIKIDRSFVSAIEERADDMAIVSAITEIARGMGIRSVAEGVENEAQLKIAKELNINVGQGYLWSPPVDADIFEKMLSGSLKETG